MGKGSDFNFNVVLGVDQVAGEVSSEEDFKGKKIFIIDDNPINIEIIERVLRAQNAEVYVSESVDDALKQVSLLTRMDCLVVDQ